MWQYWLSESVTNRVWCPMGFLALVTGTGLYWSPEGHDGMQVEENALELWRHEVAPSLGMLLCL